MSAQSVPSASQRRHWYFSLRVGTVHTAGCARIVWATCTVPWIVGALVSVSARPATSLVKVDIAIVDTPAAVAVTRTAIAWPTSLPLKV